jgi:L-asparaginase II
MSSQTNSQAPITVEVTRGALVESKHEVHAVICDLDGKIIEAYGEADHLTFPRSAIKMIQALSLAESGAIEKYDLQDRHVAIACASHMGEDQHINVIREWLQRIGLTDDDLECGAHDPSNKLAYQQMILAHDKPTRMHNNCSGKHCGILTTCLQMGWDYHGYLRWDHPVQARLRKILSEVSGLNYENVPWGVDGCGIPTYAVPLKSIAQSMSVLIRDKGVSAERRAASKRLLSAVAHEPHMISGTQAFCTEVTIISEAKTFAKTGAEGVYTALIPEKGIALALKVVDGAYRASQTVVMELMHRLGGLTDTQYVNLRNQIAPLQNWNKDLVGEIRIKI